MANSMLHTHSIYVLGLCEALHTHLPILSSQQLEGFVLLAAL